MGTQSLQERFGATGMPYCFRGMQLLTTTKPGSSFPSGITLSVTYTFSCSFCSTYSLQMSQQIKRMHSMSAIMKVVLDIASVH